MVGLDGVRQALNIEDLLVGGDAIGVVVVGCRRVGAVAFVGGADVEATIEPTVDLDAAFVLIDGLHEDVGLGVGCADDRSSTNAIVGAGEWRRLKRAGVATAHWIGTAGLGGVPVLF